MHVVDVAGPRGANHIRMIHTLAEFHFTPEACERLRVFDSFSIRQHFERDEHGIAERSLNRRSRARYTTVPIPPRPSGARMRYGPSTSPCHRPRSNLSAW